MTDAKTILLINPRATYARQIAQKCYPPMHLLYLAAALREAGFHPVVLDANAGRMTDERIAMHVRLHEPAVVGVSVYSDILTHARDIAALARRAAPDAGIVLGGPHVCAAPEQTLQQLPDADFALLGEAEQSLVDLCNALTGGTSIDDIPGIVYRVKTAPPRLAVDGTSTLPRRIVRGPDPVFPALDAVPRPARDLLADAYDRGLYYSILVRARPVDTLFTSRGCPFQCGFCYNFRPTYRWRTPEDVVDELAGIRRRGIRDVEICDDTFTGKADRVLAIFERIRAAKLDVSFRIKSRVDVFDESVARAAAAAGVYLVAFGMESGSQAVLDAMNKRTTVEANARAIALCRKYRMMSHSSWIVGYPGETPETIRQTVDFIRAHRPSTVNIAVLRPYPGTEVYERAKADGTLVGDWAPDAALPWVRLPWAPEKRILDDLARRAIRKVYFTAGYAAAFAYRIARAANWPLARYAAQEFRKAVGLF